MSRIAVQLISRLSFSTLCKLHATSIAVTLLFFFTSSQAAFAQQRKKVEIKRANTMQNIKRGSINVRRLIGNVVIVHEGITMECDSAYEYSPSNIFDAFGNVIITQGNSKLYGDVLNYNSNTKTGIVTGKIVRMVDADATLSTRNIHFNTAISSASYYNGGVITSKDGNFSSKGGTYYTISKLFTFSGNVAFQDSSIILNTDSLEYYSNTSTIHFFGPTRIYNDDNYLYCEKGWHNRQKQDSHFEQNAYFDNGKQKLIAQSIFNNRTDSITTAKGNAVLIDSARKAMLYGNEIIYWESKKKAEVLQDPLLLSVSSEGDTLFFRADRMTAVAISNEKGEILYRNFWGSKNVAFYRNNLQGVCDSILFSSNDSVLHMFIEPIIWNEENQLSAEYITTYFRDEVISKMEFKGFAFVCSEESAKHFNQIKGREMLARFHQGKLNRIDVTGNGETVYYIRDGDVLTAVNRAESSNLTISVEDNKVKSITFRDKPTATLFPIDKTQTEDVVLKGFSWKIERRPKDKSYIIPINLDLKHYIPIEEKAENFRKKKMSPATNLSSAEPKK
jgi:lipopolysaccharide export system protein LptA